MEALLASLLLGKASGDCKSGRSLPQIRVLVGPGISMLIRMSESETSRAAILDVDQIADFAAL